MKKNLTYLLLLLLSSTYGQKKQITVNTNVNIEVINALTISLYPEMLQDSTKDVWMFENTQLMRVANEYFKPYSKNIAIKKSEYLIDKLGTGIYLLGLYYEDLPKVKKKYEIPKIIWSEISKDKDSALFVIDDFFKTASSYYILTKFKKFQSINKDIYKKSIEQITQNLPNKNFISLLEKYYGDTKNSYSLIIMPFFKSEWGMGWETSGKNNKKNIFNITAPFTKQVLKPESKFDTGFDNPEKISNLCIHEFGHSFVNTLTSTEPYLSNIKKFNHLYKQIESSKQYSDWQTLFNEYIVRTGEILLMEKLGNKEFANKTRLNYKDWVYLDFFIEQMNIYQNNRIEYKSFKDYLPLLIDNLKQLK